MADDAPPSPSGDLLTRKYGPLPVWAYMGILLGAVLVWRMVAGHKASADTGSGATSTATPTPTSGYQLPSNIPPQYTTVNEDQYNNNINSNNTTTSSVTNPAPPPLPVVTPPPAAVPVPAPPAPNGKFVTVVKYHKGDTNKDKSPPSTLWGISSTVYGTGKMWRDIWNDPKNSAIVAKRKKPEDIQPGDQFWVADKPQPAPDADAKKAKG